MAKQKFYAVKVGKTPGIYTDWESCKAQVNNVTGAVYKSFGTKAGAEDFLNGTAKPVSQPNPKLPYAFVDGSFNKKTGVYGYGGFIVYEKNGTEVKEPLTGSGSNPENAEMRNVAGEIMGAKAAVTRAIELNLPRLTILYDYNGIAEWATGRWSANKPGTIAYQQFMAQAQTEIRLSFQKVKGHSGIDGNEEADRLAKQAVGL